MTTIKRTSPLGSASNIYLVKSNEHGAILDQPAKGLIELYPAGYTKPDRDGESRQKSYGIIYNTAVSLETEENLYPFKKETHKLVLLPDPLNPFDARAIHIILRANNKSPLHRLDGADLGFIPKKINTYILNALTNPDKVQLLSGRILKVKANFHKKYYSAKVIFPYGGNSFDRASTISLSRFSHILEE